MQAALIKMLDCLCGHFSPGFTHFSLSPSLSLSVNPHAQYRIHCRKYLSYVVKKGKKSALFTFEVIFMS